MTKKRVLMITPYLPRTSTSGGQTRSYYLIKHISKLIDISLICFTRDEEGLKELQPYCKKIIIIKRGKTWDLKKILSTGFGPYPFLITNYISNELKEKIAQEIATNQYDLIHTECFYLMPNIPQTNLPIFLVDQTIEYAVYQHYTDTLRGLIKILTPLLYIDVYKLKYWENYYWKQTNYLAAVSEDDKKVIQQDTGRKDVLVLPNGVDQNYLNTKHLTPKTPYPSILFGISNMKWMQNREGAELLLKQVWPKIQQAIPDCRLYIIGRNAPQIFHDYANDNVIIAEAETDGQANDPVSYYQRCWLLVAPILSGNGTRTKFFEAMATGLPILTTKQGMEGIPAKNGEHAHIVPFNQLVNQAIKLLKNSGLRNPLGQKAKKFVESNYTWEISAQKQVNIYEQITR